MTTPPHPTAPTTREIADLTARLRALAHRDRAVDPARDAAERAAFLADKDALLDRITATDAADRRGWTEELSAVDAAVRLEAAGIDPDTAEDAVRAHLDATGRTAPDGSIDDAYLDDHELATIRVQLRTGEHGVGYAEEAITHREAAERLTEHGYDAATAQRLVADYLDDTSREIGASVHQWGMDQHDVDAIVANGRGRYAPVAVPAQRSATEIPEQERREQFARWQADDEQPDADAAVRER